MLLAPDLSTTDTVMEVPPGLGTQQAGCQNKNKDLIQEEEIQVNVSDPVKPGIQDGLFLVTFATMLTCCQVLNLIENRNYIRF